jgi:hypothetical protein
MGYRCDKGGYVKIERAYGNKFVAFCSCKWETQPGTEEQTRKDFDAHATEYEQVGYRG